MLVGRVDNKNDLEPVRPIAPTGMRPVQLIRQRWSLQYSPSHHDPGVQEVVSLGRQPGRHAAPGRQLGFPGHDELASVIAQAPIVLADTQVYDPAPAGVAAIGARCGPGRRHRAGQQAGCAANEATPLGLAGL